MYFNDAKAKRLEFRCPDPTANPYLSFSACLMAGLDGIQNKIDPGKPMDTDIYELPKAQARRVKQVPGSLDASLAALEADHAFLTKGGVFSEDFINLYIDYKRTMEAADTLYGVTMEELGVSKLVSVDLKRAEDMVRPQEQPVGE